MKYYKQNKIYIFITKFRTGDSIWEGSTQNLLWIYISSSHASLHMERIRHLAIHKVVALVKHQMRQVEVALEEHRSHQAAYLDLHIHPKEAFQVEHRTIRLNDVFVSYSFFV